MPDLGILGLEFENTIVIFETSALEFFLTAKFFKRIKTPKFGTKDALFGNS